MKEEFIKLLKETNREGMDKLIEFLENSDFFEAPASTRYHGNFKGGLVEHSMKVYEILKTKVEEGKIDGVTNNGDGTLTVKKDGYSVTVDDSKQPSNDTATDKGTLVINTKIAKFAQNTVSAQLSFSVKAELNGKNVYNNIVNVAHSKNAGEKAMVIKDIPVGANVTINAIYNTLSYKLTSSETATVKLENNTKTVNFEYTYDYKNISGSSATTAVVYNGSSLSQK